MQVRIKSHNFLSQRSIFRHILSPMKLWKNISNKAILIQGLYGLESQEERYENFGGSGNAREFFSKKLQRQRKSRKILLYFFMEIKVDRRK